MTYDEIGKALADALEEGFRTGVEAAASSVEAQVLAPHFTANTRAAIVCVIRALAKTDAGKEKP